jgi:hypothetical protein
MEAGEDAQRDTSGGTAPRRRLTKLRDADEAVGRVDMSSSAGR